MRFSRLSRYIVILFTVVLSGWFALTYGSMRGTFYGDGLGYYLYLPATFIYHNFNSITKYPEDSKVDRMILFYANVMRAEGAHGANGRILIQYTYGVALLELPFFLIAHAYEHFNGLGANGFTLPYDYMMKLAAVVYALLGLIFVYKILRYYFDEWPSLLGTILTFLGTNLFWFTLDQAGMSHVPLFFLYAVLVFLTILVHKEPKLYRFILIGLVAGMITIIRPSDIVCLFIPVLYQVYNWRTLKEKLLFIKTNRTGIIACALAFILPVIPQLVYWKSVTGSFLFYSYGTQSFNWRDPHIADGLFSGANGWLPYAPIMVFALLGLVFYKYFKNWVWCIWVVLPLYIYIIYSWYCYNYINGLGSRPMIHMYPLLAIPLTAFIRYVSGRKIIWKFSFFLVAVFCVAVNICFSMQQQIGILNSEDANIRYDLQMLFRMHPAYNDLVVYDLNQFQPDQSKITKLKTLGCENYEDSVSDHYVKDTSSRSRYVYHMLDEEFNPKAIRVQYDKKLFGEAKWFKCSGRFMCTSTPDYYSNQLALSLKHQNENESYFWKAVKVENKIGVSDGSCQHDPVRLDHFEKDKWDHVYFYIRIPQDIREGDNVELYLWSLKKREIYLDDVCLELYK